MITEEAQQNASRDSWSFEYSEQRPHEIMHDIHNRCQVTAEESGQLGNYVARANIAAYTKVTDAMLAPGLT